MASTSGPRRSSDARSGGKIVSYRRRRTNVTPYDRPPPPVPQPKSPNWLTGVVFPATRTIISSAAKVISTDFNSDSSSSSDSDSDYDDVKDDNGYDTIPREVDEPNKIVESPSEMVRRFSWEPQRSVGRTETKQIIEKLLMQERFSREECDKLIEIIKSRVLESSIIEESEDGVHTTTAGRAFDNNDGSGKAVIEARRWLEEKRTRSRSGQEFTQGTSGFNTGPLHDLDNEVGSPVDVAKSYMSARPPWASPSIKDTDIRSPLTMMSDISKEAASVSGGDYSSSSLKKRKLSLSGSWNIQEEIRRVRSKATEDMLRTPSKIDLSVFVEAPGTGVMSVADDMIVTSKRDEIDGVNPSTKSKLADASTNLEDAASLSQPVVDLLKDQKESDAGQITDGYAAPETHPSVGHDLVLEQPIQGMVPQSSSNAEGAMVNQALLDLQNSNGLPPSQASLSAAVGSGENDGQTDHDNPNPPTASNGKLNNVILEKEKPELAEASAEVLNVDETNSVEGGSQNSSGMPNEELSEGPITEQTPTVKADDVAAKDDSTVAKAGGAAGTEQAKKYGRYSRRGRGRGRGK